MNPFFKRLFFTFLISAKIFAQSVSINEVLDANLIKLSDKRIIKLAGVDTPSCSSSVPYLRKVARDVKGFLNSYQYSKLTMDSISYNEQGKFLLVFLYRNYPFDKSCLNEKILGEGFGKFINNLDGRDSSSLKIAEQSGMKNQIGIWKYYTPVFTDTLDESLSRRNLASIPLVDSMKLENNYKKRPLIISVASEVLAGSALTAVSTIGGALIGLGLFNHNGYGAGFGGAFIGFSAGYLIGFPWIIYNAEKDENPSLNFWANLGCSWGLTLLTGAIAYEKNNPTLNWIAALSPIIGSMLYVHAIAPQGPRAMDDSFLLPEKKIISFKDLRDSKTSTLEFFRINF